MKIVKVKELKNFYSSLYIKNNFDLQTVLIFNIVRCLIYKKYDHGGHKTPTAIKTHLTKSLLTCMVHLFTLSFPRVKKQDLRQRVSIAHSHESIFPAAVGQGVK